MRNYLKYLLLTIFLPSGILAFSQNLVPIDTMGNGYLLMEDFESGAPGWTIYNSVADGFEIGFPTTGPNGVHSGSNCVATNLDGNYYYYGGYYTLTSPSVSISASAKNVQFSCWRWLQTESCCDYAYYQISTDGGSSWSNLGDERGDVYTSTGYGEVSFSLDSYIGQTILIRFYLTMDGSVNRPGWYIDDVSITADYINKITRDVPTLFIIDGNDVWLNDTTINGYWSTLEPVAGSLILGNFGIDTNLIIDTIYSTSTDLQVSQAAADTIPTAFGTSFSYSYQPSTAGPVSDTIYIVSNDTASPFVIILEGQANEAMLEPLPELSFNGEIIGPDNFLNPTKIIDSLIDAYNSVDIYVDLKLTNKGATPVNISNYFSKYAGNNAFWIENWSGTFIEFGDTATITIGFNAQRARRQVFSISYDFTTRDGDQVTWDHWVSAQNSFIGTYLEADGSWNYAGPDSLVIDFGEVVVGSSDFAAGIWLKNLGSIPLDINIRIEGTDFSYIGENPVHLESAQGSDEYDEGVLFTPSDSTGIIEGLLIFSHNDTTPGAIDTAYLVGKGIILPPDPTPAEFTLYYQGNAIERDSVLEIDMGNAMIYNDYTTVDFMVVNSGEEAGNINWEYIGSYFYWIDENGTWWSSLSNINIPAGDSLKFSVAFDPDHGYLFEDWGDIYFEDQNNYIYLDVKGTGIERHSFLVRNWSSDIDEYDVVPVYNYDGWEAETDFSYTNLHESSITIDSIILVNGETLTVLNAQNLPTTLEPGETYDFNTTFDPTDADGIHQSIIKIYTTNLTEPVFIFYLNNAALGWGSFNVDLISNNADYSYVNLDMGEISSIDGSRTATMRIYSTNGYNVVIDTADFDWGTSMYSYGNLPGNLEIPEGDSADFTITVEPRDVSGWMTNMLYLYYPYQNYSSSNINDFDIYIGCWAKDNRTQTPELTVWCNGMQLANNNIIDFGDTPMQDGIENLILALENSGVQYITVSNVSFSNSAFSMMEWDNMFDEFEVWYYGPETMMLYFNPVLADVEEGTMTIYSDDPTNPEFVINLKGTGTSGIDDVLTDKISVYPNPATNNFKIQTGYNGLSFVEILNSSGEVIFSDYIVDGFVKDVSNFEAGLYVVKINTGDKLELRKLVIK